MAKTLADMTQEERVDCVGMWADVVGRDNAVIISTMEPNYCWVIYPEDGGYVATCPAGIVTPRPDLPRAWTAEAQPATPVEGTYEYSFQIKYSDGWETACNDVTDLDEWWPNRSEAEEAANSNYDPIERPMRLLRRRVSPPEVLPNTTINPATAGST